MIYNGYEYRIVKGIYRRRNLVKKNIDKYSWRRVCIHNNCMSISKGKSGKCIKHQKGNRCNMLNCKKFRKNDMYCSIHTLSKDIPKKDIPKKDIPNNKEKPNKGKLLSFAKHLLTNNTWIFYDNLQINNYNNFNSTKCQGLCCSFYKEDEKPEGTYCNKEGKFLCKLCFVF
tara:strand:- start:4364 stop:4876 length:513 start_codon:yes stop_codon:yes gene_type:complete